jgi:hypothetical protein
MLAQALQPARQGALAAIAAAADALDKQSPVLIERKVINVNHTVRANTFDRSASLPDNSVSVT